MYMYVASDCKVYQHCEKYCFSESFALNQFPVREIQYRTHKISEISIPCKAHFKSFQLSCLVSAACMYKTEVVLKCLTFCMPRNFS